MFTRLLTPKNWGSRGGGREEWGGEGRDVGGGCVNGKELWNNGTMNVIAS